jgi:hypothetical protein
VAMSTYQQQPTARSLQTREGLNSGASRRNKKNKKGDLSKALAGREEKSRREKE